MDYREFFRLREHPFRITPDPAYFFPSDAHREALQTLLYSIRSGEGFVQISGEPGTGKTLLIRTILKELGDEVATALILNPNLSPSELLKVLLEDLGLDPARFRDLSREEQLRWFRDYLLARAERDEKVVCIIDEAQNLPPETMEELRMLSNLETEKQKLLQIIMVGQLELEEKLKSPSLKQLHQRITIRYRLRRLTKEEIQAYIYHRLRIASAEDRAPDLRFSGGALRQVFRWSQGIPRLVNVICERGVMAAYVEGKHRVDTAEIKKAVESVRGSEELPAAATAVHPLLVAVPALLLVLLAATALAWQFNPGLFAGLPWVDEERVAVRQQAQALQAQAREIAEQEARVRLREAEILAQEKAIRDQEAEIRAQEEAMLARREVLAEDEERLLARGRELAARESAIREEAEQLGDSREDRQRLEALAEERQRLAAERESLGVELDQARRSAEQVEAAAAARLAEERARMEAERRRLQAEIEKARQSAEAQAAALEKERQALSGKLEAARRAADQQAAERLEAERRRLAEELTAARQEAVRARDAADRMAWERTELEKERRRLQDELEAARTQAQERAATLEKDQRRLAAELAEAERRADAQEALRLEAEQARLTTELEAARREVEAREEDRRRVALSDGGPGATQLLRSPLDILRRAPGAGPEGGVAKTGAEMPTDPTGPAGPPDLVFSAAPGAEFATLDLSRGQLAVWRSDRQGRIGLLHRERLAWPHGPGLFLVGDDPAFGPYLFQHLAFMRGRPTAWPAADLWRQVAPHVKGNAVPLLVHFPGAAGPEAVARAGRTPEVFEAFLRYWSKMEADQLFEHYTPMVSRYRLDRDRPEIFSLRQAAQRRERIFARNDYIEIQAERPVFMLDPTDPGAVMVVYHQQYRSQTWNDDGTKVVYLSQAANPRGSGEASWLVSGELWVTDK